MDFSRRSFLRGVAAVPILVGAPELLSVRPALPREPFVRVGDQVSYVGLNLHPDPCFIGSAEVWSVDEWDGSAYPVRVGESRTVILLDGKPVIHSQYSLAFSDHDLCDFNADLPRWMWNDAVTQSQHPRFWDEISPTGWPNVHAWVRHQRFGEDVSVSWKKLHAFRTQGSWPHRML